MKKINSMIILIILVFVLIGINYSFIDGFLVKNFGNFEGGIVERVIDGDTIVVNNETIRLLGINTPERGEKYYEEAKEFLEKKILGEYIQFEFSGEKKDLYGRTLAYIIFENENLNLELIEEGLGNCYFFEKDRYYEKCFENWKNCENNLCEKSEDKCVNCIKLKKLDYKNEIIELENVCDFNCDLDNWEIKDEGRKKFYFENFVLESGKSVEIIVDEGKNSEDKLFWKNKDYVWTDSGDTLFLRDGFGKLVLYYNY